MIKKESVLFIPALALSADLFKPQIHELSQNFSVSIGDHTQDDSFEKMAQRILQSAPERFALVGLSMGGYASFEILRQAPERVSRLALLDTSYKADTAEKRHNRERQIELTKAGKYESLCEIMWEGLVAPQRKSDLELKARVFSMMREVGEKAFIRQQFAIMSRTDNTVLLPSVKVPTLVLVGEDDSLTPPDLAREMAQQIPGAVVDVIPECGHLSTLERPDRVTHALQKWLAS